VTTTTTQTSGEEYYYAQLLRILLCTFMCTSDDNNNGSYALANMSMMIYNIHPSEEGCAKMAEAHYEII